MNAPIKIVTVKGETISLEQWQVLYNLPVGSDQFGKYFRATESRFAKDIQEFGELIVNELLIRVLDAFRETVRRPVTINSFNRDEEKQKQLKEAGYKTAQYSPHVVKMAADIDTTSPEQSRSYVLMLHRCASELNIKVRIGCEQYIAAGQTFIHVDVCPEFYATGKPFHNQFHPKAWEQVITW